MRRFQPLLALPGLLLAPIIALAGPNTLPYPSQTALSLNHPNVFMVPQVSSPPIQFQNQGSPLGISFIFNCSTGMSCSMVNGVMTVTSTGGSGTITSCGTTNAVALFTAATTVGCDTNTTDASGVWTYAAAGAASTPAVTLSGAPYSAGNGTTNMPLLYMNTSGASAITTFTAGTYLGINAASGFAGKYFDFRVNGGAATAAFAAGISGVGANPFLLLPQSGYLVFGGLAGLSSPSDGVIRLINNAQNGFTRLAIGPDTTSFPALCPSGTALQIMVAAACTTLAPVTASTIQTATITSATNCAANGTAANPSVVSCSSARAGMFSCATNASTGTCQVNTTAVTANSEITITQDAADGGASQLNVTCNTANDLPSTSPILASKNAGTSFTINVGTISTNPACFEYTITN